LPFFASMCVATVYGRYHYVADVLAGLVVGAMGFTLGTTLMKRTGALPEVADEDACGARSAQARMPFVPLGRFFIGQRDR